MPSSKVRRFHRPPSLPLCLLAASRTSSALLPVGGGTWLSTRLTRSRPSSPAFPSRLPFSYSIVMPCTQSASTSRRVRRPSPSFAWRGRDETLTSACADLHRQVLCLQGALHASSKDRAWTSTSCDVGSAMHAGCEPHPLLAPRSSTSASWQAASTWCVDRLRMLPACARAQRTQARSKSLPGESDRACSHRRTDPQRDQRPQGHLAGSQEHRHAVGCVCWPL